VDSLEAALFRFECQRQVDAVERLFGLRLRPWWAFRSRLRVYVFPSLAAVSEVYGGPVGGFASWDHWHVAVNLETQWGEIVRHEVAHILGACWNPRPMTLLCEGLAVWAQRTYGGQSPDDYARRIGVHGVDATIEWLLGPDPVLGTWHRKLYYAVAGSFTRALIERFGFTNYQKLYGDKAVSVANFTKEFCRHFGVPLRSFVRDWLTNLTVHSRLT
jgi:hypothetical protein